jgi:hypothetical protein
MGYTAWRWPTTPASGSRNTSARQEERATMARTQNLPAAVGARIREATVEVCARKGGPRRAKEASVLAENSRVNPEAIGAARG